MRFLSTESFFFFLDLTTKGRDLIWPVSLDPPIAAAAPAAPAPAAAVAPAAADDDNDNAEAAAAAAAVSFFSR